MPENINQFAHNKKLCIASICMLISLLLISDECCYAGKDYVFEGGDTADSLSFYKKILDHEPHNPYPARRKPVFMLIGKSKIIKYNPVYLTFGALLYGYQSVISTQIAADCPYEISCSAFSKQCIVQYGLIKGAALTADRLTRCTRLSVKDIPPIRFSDRKKLIDKPSFYSLRQHP